MQIGHANYNGKPLNYNKEEKFARTQDLQQVELFFTAHLWLGTQIYSRQVLRKKAMV